MTVLQIVKVSSKPPMMSFQCPYDVIPVPRHWDPGILLSIKVAVLC
ncbi:MULTISPECIES: hypothetical protein [Wolbachia]|nr:MULTISPECIES: hypothetical protein [Wolbachia]UJQ20515.1 hypothetical protein L2227_04850 [Wolbachia endosymbiont of Delia radicum]